MNDIEKNGNRKIQHWQVIAVLLAAFDFLSVVLSYTLALFMRFDFKYSEIPSLYLHRNIRIVLIYAAACVIVYSLFTLYRSMWRFASYTELLRCLLACFSCFVPLFVLSRLFFIMPAIWYAFGFAGQLVLAIGVRFWYRFINLLKSRNDNEKVKSSVLLVGAGSAG